MSSAKRPAPRLHSDAVTSPAARVKNSRLASSACGDATILWIAALYSVRLNWSTCSDDDCLSPVEALPPPHAPFITMTAHTTATHVARITAPVYCRDCAVEARRFCLSRCVDGVDEA